MSNLTRPFKRRIAETLPAMVENSALEAVTLLDGNTESIAVLESSDGRQIVVDTLFLAQYSDFFKCAFYGPTNDYVERRRRRMRLVTIAFEPLVATLKILLKLVTGQAGTELFRLPHSCCSLAYPSAFSKRRKKATTNSTLNDNSNSVNNGNDINVNSNDDDGLNFCASGWLSRTLSSACSLGSKHCFDQIELLTALEILDVAAYLQLEVVLNRISNMICEMITTSTLLPTHRKAEMRYRPLADRLWRIIVEEFKVLVKAGKFVELRADELVKLLSDPKLNLHPIDEFPVVATWLNMNYADIDSQCSKAMNKLRNAIGKYSVLNREKEESLIRLKSPYVAELVMGSVLTEQLIHSINNNNFGGLAVRPRALTTSSIMTPPAPSIKATPTAVWQLGIGFYDQPRIPQSLLLAVGGWAVGGPTNQLEFYEPNRHKWLAVQSASQLTCTERRAYHALVSAVDNFSPLSTSGVSHGATYSKCLYMVGGYDGIRHHKSIHKLNLDTLKWSEVAPMNQQRCYVSGTAIDNNHIIAVGGFNEENRLRSAEVFDIAHNQWSSISMMNFIRSDADCTNIDGRIYVVGGFNGSTCHNNCEIYDPSLDKWTNISRQMHFRRSGVKAVCMNDNVLVVVGGFTGSVRLKTPEFYDPREGIWHSLADMNNKRSNFGIEKLDNRIVVCGGYNNISTTNFCESYDWCANRWQPLPDMSFSRSALSVCRIDRHPLIEDIVQEFDHGSNFPPFV